MQLYLYSLDVKFANFNVYIYPWPKCSPCFHLHPFPDKTGFAIWYLWDAGTYTNGVHFFISIYPKYFWSKDWKRFPILPHFVFDEGFRYRLQWKRIFVGVRLVELEVKFIQLLFGNIKHWSSGANDCSDNLLRQDCWLKTYLKNIGLTIDWSMVIFQSLSGRNKSG